MKLGPIRESFARERMQASLHERHSFLQALDDLRRPIILLDSITVAVEAYLDAVSPGDGMILDGAWPKVVEPVNERLGVGRYVELTREELNRAFEHVALKNDLKVRAA